MIANRGISKASETTNSGKNKLKIKNIWPKQIFLTAKAWVAFDNSRVLSSFDLFEGISLQCYPNYNDDKGTGYRESCF